MLVHSRNFECKKPVVMLLYNSGEIVSWIWGPVLVHHYKKDIDYWITGRCLESSWYEERLKGLNIFTLEQRRLRGGLIKVFMYRNKFDIVDHVKFFEQHTKARIRNNALSFHSNKCGTDISKQKKSHIGLSVCETTF